ncbi:MAG: hypothetical protein M1823_000101 [Watsoniomyces obsoletus]|nr:MAG: hypothetical protein M1823_000101 [Watsoniomyces obsoletus]
MKPTTWSERYMESSSSPEAVAKAYFEREIQRHVDGQPATQQSETVVILHDSCYGHRFSRPRTSKAALLSVVERPERLQAAALGVATAYVRLGQRYSHGADPAGWMNDDDARPRGVPFRIHRSTRTISLSSATVTNVHGDQWMKELQGMCQMADSKLEANGKELVRPEEVDGDELKPAFHEGDLYLCGQTLEALEGALGAVCDGVDAVFQASGTLDAGRPTRRAFVCVRPPGHHCSSSYPSGFCWLNNVHVGISYAADAYDLTHAAIIDFDLHHGDGSQSIAWAHNEGTLRPPKKASNHRRCNIGYFSLHDINSFPCEMGDEDKVRNASVCVENAHGQTVWNVHLQSWQTKAEFWKLYENQYRAILDKARNFLTNQVQRLSVTSNRTPRAAIFLSAGFDASEWEGATMQRHTVNVPTDFYARFTQDVVALANEDGLAVDGRVISVLEGGYSDRALSSGIFSHVAGLAGTPATMGQNRRENGLGYEMSQRMKVMESPQDVVMEEASITHQGGGPMEPPPMATHTTMDDENVSLADAMKGLSLATPSATPLPPSPLNTTPKDSGTPSRRRYDRQRKPAPSEYTSNTLRSLDRSHRDISPASTGTSPRMRRDISNPPPPLTPNNLRKRTSMASMHSRRGADSPRVMSRRASLVSLASSPSFPKPYESSTNVPQMVPSEPSSIAALKDSSQRSSTYDPSWWSLPHLEELEVLMKPPALTTAARRARTTAPPTYTSTTQSFKAKVVTSPKPYRSVSGPGMHSRLGTSNGESGRHASPTPPPPPPPPTVNWATAAYELSKLLVPTDRPTSSCRPEELSVEASRARKARHSTIGVPEVVAPRTGGTSRMALRERKGRTPNYAVDDDHDDNGQANLAAISRAHRRRTVASTAILKEKPIAAGAARPDMPSRPTTATRRRSSASFVSVATTTESGLVPPMPPAQAMAAAVAPEKTRESKTSARPASAKGVPSEDKVASPRIERAHAAPNKGRSPKKSAPPSTTSRPSTSGSVSTNKSAPAAVITNAAAPWKVQAPTSTSGTNDLQDIDQLVDRVVRIKLNPPRKPDVPSNGTG